MRCPVRPEVSGWTADCIFHGDSYSQGDAEEHASAGGDARERDQPGPEASVRGEMYVVGGERAGVRISQFGSAGVGNSHYAERFAWWRERDGTSGELSAVGE